MTCTITGTAKKPDGSTYASATFTFKRSPNSVSAQESSVVSPIDVTVTSDGAGAVSFVLMSGSYVGLETATGKPFSFNVPAASTANFNDCVSAAAITPWPDAVQATIDARDAAKASADRVDLGDLDTAKTATAADRVQTGLDAAATALDRLQTMSSALSASDSATAAATSAANAQASAYTLASWTALAAITGTAAGQGAEVLDADTGTHTDPVVGGTVANAGRYTWSASPAGWKWISATGLSAKLPTATFDSRLGNLLASMISAETGYKFVFDDDTKQICFSVSLAGKTWFVPADDLLFPVANLASDVVARLLPAGMIGAANLPPESGFMNGWPDLVGNLGFGLKLSGEFWAKFADDCIFPPGLSGQITAAVTAALLPSSTIECWGDSLTNGLGSGNPYPAVLATALGRTVNNRGIGGQTSTHIAVRQGGVALTVSVTSDQIPASGGVAVTAQSSNILVSNGAYSGTTVGTLAGVPGTISTDASGNWTFTRTTAGSVVACPPGTQFIIDQAVAGRDKTGIIWSGRNDSHLTRSLIQTTRDNILAMAAYMSPLSKRYLVVSITNGYAEGSGTTAYDNIILANAELQRTFGDRFVDLRSYLVNFGLADAGITPTAQDLIDVAADTIPESLRYDIIHLTGVGQGLVGAFMANQIKARGW